MCAPTDATVIKEAQEMMRWFSKKARSIQAFALALSVVPFAYLVSSPCGAACGGCFLGGACILAYPIPLLAVIFAKLFKKTGSNQSSNLKPSS